MTNWPIKSSVKGKSKVKIQLTCLNFDALGMNTRAQALARSLGALAPVFKAHADQITYLPSPRHFYEAILEGVDTAKHRITLATLYVGTEAMERELVSRLKKRLTGEDQDERVRIHLHMDYMRGTRGFPGDSSARLLRPLLSLRRPSATISMYLTPSLQGRSWRRLVVPPRWNEIFGLSHLKVCLFDDTIIMTGANLSTSYFTNRADRYVRVQNHAQLANYFDDLIQTIGRFSFKLSKGITEDDPELRFEHPVYDLSEASAQINDLTQRHQHEIAAEDHESDRVWLVPSLQMAPHQVRQDEQVLESLYDWFNEHCPEAQNSLASGYFNLSPLAQHIFSRAHRMRHPWSILTASPSANGFFESGGLSRYIPEAYRSIELAFLDSKNRSPLMRNERGEECIYEFSRPGWTYHAKGVWIQDTEPSPLMVTVIGSSNFGHRSFDRDLEAQLTLITESGSLIQKIQQERDSLFADSTMVSKKDILQYGPPSLPVRRATDFIKSFL